MKESNDLLASIYRTKPSSMEYCAYYVLEVRRERCFTKPNLIQRRVRANDVGKEALAAWQNFASFPKTENFAVVG